MYFATMNNIFWIRYSSSYTLCLAIQLLFLKLIKKGDIAQGLQEGGANTPARVNQNHGSTVLNVNLFNNLAKIYWLPSFVPGWTSLAQGLTRHCVPPCTVHTAPVAINADFFLCSFLLLYPCNISY